MVATRTSWSWSRYPVASVASGPIRTWRPTSDSARIRDGFERASTGRQMSRPAIEEAVEHLPRPSYRVVVWVLCF